MKRGGKLEGNASRDLLNAVDNLELALRNYSVETYCIALPFTHTMRLFRKVVDSSFKQDLVDGWEVDIENFSSSYRELKSTKGKAISIPPKVHAYNILLLTCFFSFHSDFNPDTIDYIIILQYLLNGCVNSSI